MTHIARSRATPSRRASLRARHPAARSAAQPAPRAAWRPVALAALACLGTAAHATTYVWASGNFVPGVTAPDPLGGADALQINSGSGKTFNGVAFNNQGAVAWNADALGGGNSAVINNLGLWSANSDGNSLAWQFGGQPTFNNTGTFRKAAGALTSLGNWKFVNSGGTLEAQSGTLSFNGGSPVFNDNSSFIGAGFISIDTAANFNDGFISDNLVIASGAVTGTAAKLKAGVAGAGLLRWTGGQLYGSWEIGAGQAMVGLSGGGKQLITNALTNNGTLAWQSAEPLQGANSGQLVNNALFDAQTSTTAVWAAGGQPSFTNSATGIVRSSGAGTVFNSGNFSWVSNGGRFDATAGTSLVFNGGTARFNKGTRFTGTGSILVTNNASFVDGFTSANLTLAGGTVTGGSGAAGSKAVLSGKVGWSGGTLAGNWQIAANQTLSGVAGAGKQMLGTLTNLGNLAWTTVESLQGANSASLVNKKVIDASLTSNLIWVAGGQPTLTNAAAGIVRASAGATFSLNNWNIVSNGGQFDAKAGSALVFNGANNTFNEGTRFIGAGSNSVTGTARVVGGITSANLSLTSGSFIGGDGTPASRGLLNGTTTWLGGDFSGAWTLPASQQISVTGSAVAKRLVGASFVNDGTLLWNATDALQGANSAAWTNNGLFEARKSTSMDWVAGGQPAFVNSATGLLRASQGATLTVNNFNLTSEGGRFDAKANSTIQFTGGSATFKDNTQFIGAGSNRVVGGARFIGRQQSSNLTLAGGTLTGGDGTAGSMATLRGTTAWAGGDLSGAWQLDASQALNVAGPGNRRVGNGSFNNLGNLNWASDESLGLFNSASIVNDGSLLLQSDADIAWVAGGQPSLVNNGLLRKAAGTGDSSLASLQVTNNGTLQVDTGTLSLPNGFTNGGVLAGSGSFGAGTLTNAGVVSPGNFIAALGAQAMPFAGSGARIAQSGTTATLNFTGSYNQTAAGSLDMQITSTSALDRVLVNGNATLAGTLNVGCLGTCHFNTGNTLVLLDATGTLTGKFSAVNFVGLPANAFKVTYDTAGGRVLLRVTAPVAAAGSAAVP